MKNFWQEFEKPIFGLSPMDGITDCPFRLITKKYGKADVVYTEFINVEALFYNSPRVIKQIIFVKEERPIVAQLYGQNPHFFYLATFLMLLLGFDAIDLNMGCPASKVVGNGSGAALIGNYVVVTEIVNQVKKAFFDWKNGEINNSLKDFLINFFYQNSFMMIYLSKDVILSDCDQKPSEGVLKSEIILTKIKKKMANILNKKNDLLFDFPLSFKTRIGFDKILTNEWIKFLLQFQPQVIAVHGRTAKQGYVGEVNWEEIGCASQLAKKTSTKILGNGDLNSRVESLTKINNYQLDGVLIGRKALGNPFIFDDKKMDNLSYFLLAYEHACLFEQIFGRLNTFSFLPMRKYLAAYVKNFPQAKKIRSQLVLTNDSKEIKNIFIFYLTLLRIKSASI